MIYVAATTGARRGELCGLRWSDVDLDAATATFARSISDAGGEVAVKDPKTHQARRIALDASTVAVLREHRRRAEERSQLAGVKLGPDAYVWSQDLDAVTPYRPGGPYHSPPGGPRYSGRWCLLSIHREPSRFSE